MKKKFKNIELFAGAGGLALGLELSGFNCECLIEIDKYCCETLKKKQNKLKYHKFIY